MPNRISAISKIGSEVLEFGKHLASDFIATQMVMGGRGHLSSHTAERITKEKVSVFSMRDNAQFLLLVTSADRRFRANGAIIKKISEVFLDFLWSHTEDGVREELIKKATAGVKINATYMATFNVESEAKQFLMLPMIALIAEMYQLTDGDLKKAEEAILSFTSLEPEQMYRFYTAFIAQPEKPLDKFRRWWHNFLQENEATKAETIRIFDGPDGFLAELEADR